MPLRRGKPITFRPTTVCDAVDGTNAPAGALQSSSNLIPDPSTDKVWVPRPAAIQNVSGSAFGNPGFMSGLLVVGNTAYGTIASPLNPGFDQPFAVNLLTNTFLTIAGITAGNVPKSQLPIGDWTPPILAQVGSRIIVTHPGFPGGAVKFGWFDISSFSDVTVGDTNSSTLITGNPNILGVQPGMTIAANVIPAGTTVVSAAEFVSTQSCTSNSNTTLDVTSLTGLAVGQLVSENPTLGIGPGVTIAGFPGGNTVTLSSAASASASGTITFTGATITMSAAAENTANGVSLTIAGGTPTEPQWGAGDTNINNLPNVPVGVAQFNGRAYFALGLNGIALSDSLVPCQITNATQFLTTDDGLVVTAIGPLMEYSALTGGIVQGLIAFEGATKMQQITGDPTTSNLSMNSLPVATGTLSPLSVQPCELGLAFMSTQGLRIVDFSGRVSPPIGDHGQGVTVPFIYAVNPSRICVAANSDVIRITAKNGSIQGQPNQEWWYDITRKIWSGPHTFPASLIQPWGDTFLLSPADQSLNGSLWQSDPQPNLTSNYTENGAVLAWNFQTTLLPDNAELAMNTLVDMTIALALGPYATTVALLDENSNVIVGEGGTLDASILLAAAGTQTLWGSFQWGNASWGGSLSPLQQRSIDWPFPPVFKQMSVLLIGNSSFGLRVGNIYMRYQILGYRLQEPQFIGGISGLLSDKLQPLTSDSGEPMTEL